MTKTAQAAEAALAALIAENAELKRRWNALGDYVEEMDDVHLYELMGKIELENE